MSLLNFSTLVSEVYHHYPQLRELDASYIWEELHVEPFDEMILSWNAPRPVEGDYRISLMVLSEEDEWSPWMPYMHWGNKGQKSFDWKDEKGFLHINQDCLNILGGQKAKAFKVRFEATNNAGLNGLHAVHAYTKTQSNSEYCLPDISIELAVPGISQIALLHPRAMHLCSPTSTTSVVQYLLQSNRLNPVRFARNVLDDGFDIYGNWVLNVAQAAHELGKGWQCWVERLENFQALFKKLQGGTPVVVSVRGPLPGAEHPYKQGHLIVVRGYDAETGEVLCMDPAYSTNEKTYVGYRLEDFLQAWSRRGNVAYIFQKCN